MTLCKCGCGREIIIKPHHKYTGVPKYILGHNGYKTFEDIWKDIVKNENTGCWEYSGHKNKHGYGILEIKDKPYRVHRISYELTYGKIPEGKVVCHTCDNPACCNPKHLWLGTQKNNMSDMVLKKRSNRGEQRPLHKLKNQEVKEIRYLYSTGKYTQSYLGKLFNVSQDLISRITLRKIWRHI
jgi:hypothetical protein